MRPTLLATAVLATALPTTVLSAATCKYIPHNLFITEYQVTASGVNDIPKVCGDLWSNLRRFSDCVGVSEETCERRSNGDLYWKFWNGSGCNRGMVHSAWYEATKNQWGGIDCQL